MDMPDIKLKGNVNKLGDQVVNVIKDGIKGLGIDQALIVNATSKPVTFHVYNYIDSVHWIAAMKTHVAPGKSGTVAASGNFFKIHPDDDKNHEFLVAPKKAYVYNGPGDIDTVEKG